MAIDTAAKRQSTSSWGLPWRTPPFPDGTIGQGDRQAAGFMYSGIAAGTLIQFFGPIEFTIPRSDLEFTIDHESLEFTIKK
jgi:hypothetical protein